MDSAPRKQPVHERLHLALMHQFTDFDLDQIFNSPNEKMHVSVHSLGVILCTI